MLRKWLRLAGLTAFGFILGFAAANLYFEHGFASGKWFGAVATSFMAGQYAHTQYREADYASASAAMQAYISYLDHLAPYQEPWKPNQSPWLGPEGLLLDKTLAWSRLAILHERNGNTAATEAAWLRAQDYATKCRWRNTSREHMRSVIARIDKDQSPNVPGP